MGLYTFDPEQPQTRQLFTNRNKNTLINTSYQGSIGETWKIQTGIAFSRTEDNGSIGDAVYERTDSYLQWRGSATHYLGTYSRMVVGSELVHGAFGEGLDLLHREYRHEWGALFTEADWFLNPRWVLRTGLRGEYSAYIRQFNLAPRVTLSHKLSKHLQAALAYGTFYQNPEDQYWVIQRNIGYERASHYLANMEYVSNDFTFRIEGYHKDYRDLVNETARGLTNGGFGYASGIDIFWRDRKSINNAEYWVSYSLLDTKRLFADYPVSATPPFAARHSLNIVYKHFVPTLNSQIGTTYTYASGRPYMNPNNPLFMSDRTRDFHNVSVNVSYLTRLFGQFTVIYLSATNLLGTDNIFGYQYSTDGSTRRAIRPGARREFFIGALLTIGDNTFIR